MGLPWLPQNPGIDLEQLTDAEIAVVETLAALGDPGADRIVFWDESDNGLRYLEVGSGLSIVGTTLSASGSSGASTALDNLASVAINTSLLLGASDGGALGSATKMWSDLFLASGAVINFNNGDLTLTHSSDKLDIDGGVVDFGSTPTVNGSAIYFAGGTDVAVADGGTGLSTISALSLLVANSANTFIELTPGASQSIRINAAGNAWEAYTPASAGASTALDNLASVAINTSLLLGASDGGALGSTTKMWSDLFLASGAVINFNNGDVTLTHAADKLTLAGGDLIISTPGTAAGSVATIDGTQTLSNKTFALGSNTFSGTKAQFDTAVTDDNFAYLATAQTFSALQTYSLAGATNRLVNTNNGASSQVALFEGDKSGVAANDEAYLSFKLSDSAGNQDEFARITWRGTTVTSASEVGRLQFATINAGTLTDRLYINSSYIAPASNDLLALGTTTLMFSDLFLASGSVINFNNGDVTITHASDKITVAGGDLEVPDEAYDATAWNGSLEVPTKNAIRDKIEAIAGLPVVLFNTNRLNNNGVLTYYTDDRGVHVATSDTTAIQVSRSGGRNQIRTFTSDWADADNAYSGVKLGAYVYFLLRDAATTPDTWRVYRYDYTNLAAGGTQMSFAGAKTLATGDTKPMMTSDGTNFYFAYEANNSANSYVLAKYTLSGTTLTYSSSITCGTLDEGWNDTGGYAVLASGDIYAFSNSNDRITKFNSSGTQQYQETTDSQGSSLSKIVNVENTLYGLVVSNPAGLLAKLNYE